MDEWVDELICSPLKFRDAWIRLSNGGLWTLCQKFLDGNIDAKDELQRLKELLEKHEQEFTELLQWFLKEQNLPINLAKRLLCTAAQMIDDFLTRGGGDWFTFLPEGTEEEIPRVELQGLGVQYDIGFTVRVSLELHESPYGNYHFSLHPSCCLIPQDDEFQSAIEAARRWWIENSDVANFPALITWRITRNDGHPLENLKGNSLGGLLAVGIWLLQNPEFIDQTISISAAISPDGSLQPVSGLYQKLLAAHSCNPPLRMLIVSSQQNLTNIPKFLQIQPVTSIDEAIELFKNHNHNFVKAKERIGKLHGHLMVFNQTLDWSCYQEPKLTIVSTDESSSLNDWLGTWLGGDKERHWLLVAASGMGKTTVLKFIAYRIATSKTWTHLLPVYLRADEWSRQKKTLPKVLGNLHYFSPAPTLEQWQKWAESGRLVLLVDQLEGVVSDLDFLDYIRMTIRSDYPNIYLLMATRSEHQSFFKSLDFPIVQLEPLSENQARELLQRLGQSLNRPLPSLNIPLGEIPPFLLIATLFIEPPIPQGQGQLYLKLLKFLLKETNLPLPSHRVIEILSEITFSLLDKDRWSERELYDILCKLTAPQIADQIWMAIKDRLIIRTDGFYGFVHTLLLETLRAYAFAHKWQSGDIPTNITRFLTPLRAILLTSLLDSKVLPEFWNLLQRKMEGEPKEWAEVVAKCLNERTDYPQRIVNVLLSRWFNAFCEGTNDRDGWDEAIAALPIEVVEKFVFSEAEQKLTSRSLPDRRSAALLLSLVAHKTKIPSTTAELLAKAFMDEYGFALLTEIKETFLHHPLQCETLRQFTSTIIKSLDSPLMSQRLRAIEAIEELAKACILTEDLKIEIVNYLKKLAHTDENYKIRSAAQKALLRLQSLCSS